MKRRREGRLVLPVGLLGVLSVAAFVLLPNQSLAQTVAATIPFVCAPVVLGLRVRVMRGPLRRRLKLLVVASSTYSVAMGAWYLAQALGHPVPFPSALDLVFFAVFGTYLTFLVGVLRSDGSTGKVEGQLAVVDSLVLTTTACAVIWVFLIQPSLADGAPGVATIAALTYPGMSLAMLAVAVRLAFRAGFLRSPAGWLLLTWVGAEATGDVIYGHQMTSGTFQYSSAVTALWLVAYAALATLAVHPHLPALLGPRPIGSPGAPAERHRWAAAGTGARVLAALVPFALALVDTNHASVMVIAGLALFLLVTLRSLLLAGDLRDQRRLTVQLDHALAELATQRDELEVLAFADPLTGLANRARFTHHLAGALTAHDGEADPVVGVLMLDLDDFKVVNDSLGHETGDALLIATARRLELTVGQRGTVARLGGDEFGVVLPATSPDLAHVVAEQVVDALARPFEIGGRLLHTAVSVGVATAGGRTGPQELMRDADLAMYSAKVAGKGKVRAFEPTLLERAQERLALESHLWGAVARGELDVQYQPIFDLGTGAVVCVEALARWHHPTWGPVPPSRFIPAAESTGTIVAIGECVLRKACHDVAVLNRHRDRPVSVAVNVSIRQAQDAGFLDTIARALADSGLATELLVLDVTEGLVMDVNPQTAATLGALHSMGVRLSVDDFGAGHSSVARLRKVPINALKIDGALVDHLGEDPSGGPIVAAIIAMGAALGLVVVAEGVETAAQLDALRALGCGMAQGFLLAPPAHADEIALDDLHPSIRAR